MKFSAAQFIRDHHDEIATRLEYRKTAYLSLLEGKVKNLRGSVLLVGDRPGPSAPTDLRFHHTPFYSTKYCAGWLNALLEVEGIDERRLVWINATHHDGSPFSGSIVRALAPEAVIALGGNAKKWADKNFELAVTVPHPQYWKRFQSSAPYPLIDLLKLLK